MFAKVPEACATGHQKGATRLCKDAENTSLDARLMAGSNRVLYEGLGDVIHCRDAGGRSIKYTKVPKGCRVVRQGGEQGEGFLKVIKGLVIGSLCNTLIANLRSDPVKGVRVRLYRTHGISVS